MKLMTIQLAKWRKVQPPMLLVDTSVNSGNPLLAPNWPLLQSYKSGLTTDEEYEKEFKRAIKIRWMVNHDFVNLVSHMIHEPNIQVLGCYCPAGTFCHRHLLVDFFKLYCEKNNIEFEYLGELT